MNDTQPAITVGSRVRVVDTPDRPARLNAEGAVYEVRQVGDYQRFVVDFADDARYWFYANELRLVEVQNLVAAVEVYEAAAPRSTFTFEIYDIGADYFYFAQTFARALRILRSLNDAKITRISDNVVLAQNQLGDDR